MKIPTYLPLVLSIFAATTSAYAVGSTGFENAEFSSYSLAQSNAVVAQPHEPAAISYNPAGIADLKGVQVEGNITFNSIVTRINRGNDDDINQSAGTIVPAPTGYVTTNLGPVFDDRVVLGIGSDSPFGLANKYDSNFQSVHYSGWKNWMKMYTLKPTLGVRLNDWFSIAAGAMNYRIFDFGGIQAYPNTLATSNPATPDGQVRLGLSGQGWGWHLGALIDHEKHHLGYYWRSPVNVFLRGKAKVENAAAGGPARFETGTWASMDLPMNMTLGYAYDINPKTTVELDLGYTRWSTYDRLYFYSDPVSAGDDAILAAIGHAGGNDKDYEDAYSIHLGGNHKLNEKWTFRAGSLFYTAAAPKSHFTPAVPDSNRLAFSAGLGYNLNKYLTADMSGIYMMGLARRINNDVGENALLPNSSVDGKYFTNYMIFGITMTFHWEDLFDKWAKEKPAVTSTEIIK